MRINDRFLSETDAKFCYHPVSTWKWEYYIHSSLYYEYHKEHREEMLKHQMCREPELALAIACAGEMGLFADCAEVCIWREVCKLMPEEMLREFKTKIPEMVKSISDCADGKAILHEMYFSTIIPVVTAMDAQEPQLALKLCLQAVKRLEKSAGKS